jgi:hypothetical protein
MALANAAFGTSYLSTSAEDEAMAVADVVSKYGFDQFTGKPGFSPMEW